MDKFEELLQEIRTNRAKDYKFYKEHGWDELINDNMLKSVAKGAYVNDNGTFDGIEEGYKPYYDYLKYGNQYQEEVKEEPIMIEDNNYDYEYNYEDTYETPYSFEYEPYMIQFDHEVSYNEPIQQEEVVYEEPIVEEENVDINELINIVDILTNKITKVKKTIIHYISNYRPIMNQYTDAIEAVLIE